jgi:hydroxymethylpyrimidine/phosphomethylpyrimidine kinase
MSRSFVISLAGMDGSAGAGLLSDIKTFESLGVYGLGVCTALTCQTHERFYSMQWQTPTQILDQAAPLLDTYPVRAAKIGLISGLECLLEVIEALKKKDRDLKIVWDPILSSSSGFVFHNNFEGLERGKACRHIDIMTPNFEELKKMGGTKSPKAFTEAIRRHCAILVKSCFRSNGQVGDRLYTENEKHDFFCDEAPNSEKHGSGCVLSSALAASLALDLDLVASVKKARACCHRFHLSSSSLLGNHTRIQATEETL